MTLLNEAHEFTAFIQKSFCFQFMSILAITVEGSGGHSFLRINCLVIVDFTPKTNRAA